MGIDRALTRSAASSQITRKLVAMRSIDDGIVAGAQGLRIENANGDVLDIFAGVILMRAKGLTDYALIDLQDLEIEARAIQFIEDEPVPHDSEVIDHAWAKSNKDGSRDRRYADNHQIPIVRYGRIEFASAGGLREAYMVSDPNLALRFAEAFEAFKAALRKQASRTPSAAEPWAGMVAPAHSKKSLPDLPKVAGAYELLLLPVALALAPVAATSWQQKEAAPLPPLAVAAMPSTTYKKRIL
jgi:hypothetical protein